MTSNMSAKDIRVLEDALSAVVRDARVTLKELQKTLADGRAMMEEVVEVAFTRAVQGNVDEALAVMYGKLQSLTVESTKKQMEIMETISQKVFKGWEPDDIAETLKLANLMVMMKRNIQTMTGDTAFSYDPIETFKNSDFDEIRGLAEKMEKETKRGNFINHEILDVPGNEVKIGNIRIVIE